MIFNFKEEIRWLRPIGICLLVDSGSVANWLWSEPAAERLLPRFAVF